MQIEDYEPRHSIVITPIKMAQYYEDVKLSKEVYSWSRMCLELRKRGIAPLT